MEEHVKQNDPKMIPTIILFRSLDAWVIPIKVLTCRCPLLTWVSQVWTGGDDRRLWDRCKRWRRGGEKAQETIRCIQHATLKWTLYEHSIQHDGHIRDALQTGNYADCSMNTQEHIHIGETIHCWLHAHCTVMNTEEHRNMWTRCFITLPILPSVGP